MNAPHAFIIGRKLGEMRKQKKSRLRTIPLSMNLHLESATVISAQDKYSTFLDLSSYRGGHLLNPTIARSSTSRYTFLDSAAIMVLCLLDFHSGQHHNLHCSLDWETGESHQENRPGR